MGRVTSNEFGIKKIYR